MAIVLRYPGGLSKALTLSYDDAVCEDFRLISLMEENGLKGTFNINTSQYCTEESFVNRPAGQWAHRMPKERATELYGRECVEPALHSLTHPWLEKMPVAQMTYEIVQDRKNLEDQFGRIVRGMAYPYGTYSDTVIQVLRDCGIIYARTVQSTHNFDLPADFLKLHPTCHHSDSKLSELTQKFINETPPAHKDGWLFYLWGHAYEFERDHNWSIIEQFAETIGKKTDIWYATNGEIVEYVLAFRSLIFSLDGTRVYNPTDRTVWFLRNGVLFEISSGQTRSLTEQA